mgnify:CR=1 FL=1
MSNIGNSNSNDQKTTAIGFHLRKVPHTVATTTTCNTTSNSSAASCCTRICTCPNRLRAEFRHPPFHSNDAVSGKLIHGPQSVGPSGVWILLLKSILVAWIIAVVVDGITEANPPRVFYLAYLTHWSLLVTMAYFISSWFHTLQNSSTLLQRKYTTTTTTNSTTTNQQQNHPTILHKLTWGLFALAAPAEIVVTVGYWTLEWDGSTGTGFYYRNIMVHGGCLILVLLDGFYINRIPVRLRHFGLLFAYLLLYMIWTLIHALLEIGNPDYENDDNLYTALQWKEEPWSTLQYAGLFLLVLAPLAFCFVWCLSLYSCPCNWSGDNRRYVDDAEDNSTGDGYHEHEHDVSYVEMGNHPPKTTATTVFSKV